MRDLTVTFQGDRGQARVVDGIDVDIYRGEVLGVVGESGSGKSMFASALLDGVEDPGIVQGEITYYPEDGEPIDVLDLSQGDLNRVRWEEIAMMFQGAMSSFNPTTPIRTHFRETLEAHNADVEAGLQRAEEILADLNLDPQYMRDTSTYQHELSGGEQQRLLLALSLILEPEVLVLDEPTAALDLLRQRSILNLLHDVKEEYDLTLVFISHDLPVITGLADRVGVMYGFEFVELGKKHDVMYDAAHPYTRGLLRTTPSLTGDIDSITTIEGSPPDPVNVPTGCPFHPRCPVSDDRCEIETPDLTPMDAEGHRAACFYPDDAEKEIDTKLERGDGA